MLEKTYNPSEIEQSWYQLWEQRGYFQPSGNGASYSIMIPPPNVTGSLHMGHAFQSTLMDVLIRYQRMRGRNVLWQVGCDHAGIATQLLVERKLKAETGKNRRDFERNDFIEQIWRWKQHSHKVITGQMRRLGISVDWSSERFTMDPDYCQAVRRAFISLYEAGLIYRGEFLVNWDPVLQTAVSDLEIKANPEKAKLYHVRYPFVDASDEYMVIATTRPETILADGALAVHPDDERYKKIVGRKVHVPNTDRIIPIIADDYVKAEFGTGCVKITPAHDFNDYQVGQRHEMEIINLFTPTAHMNANAPKQYQGMERHAAREQIIKDLQAQGLLVKAEDHEHSPPRGDRTGVILEPYMTKQWFVKVDSLAKSAGDMVRSGAIKFVPKQWENAYFAWVDNMRDWCISRQLWWGHQIPAFYDKDGNCYIAESEEQARAQHQLPADCQLSQDQDVLDTWFSSALWTFATLGWPEPTDRLKRYHPSSVLVTGFDIIFFWVARMIMMSGQLMDTKPFSEVYIHGLVRDAQGHKMSKSKGNILDPLDVIDGVELDELLDKRTSNLIAGDADKAEQISAQTRAEYPEGLPAFGTDALRFSFCALASNGRDLNFDVKRIAGYRNFCNKLWNAARYVLINCEHKPVMQHDEVVLSMADKWIVTRLQQCIASVHKHMSDYRFDWVAQDIYQYVWEDYCDWYLELSKPILASDDDAAANAARLTMLEVLEVVLRLAHPIIPFISEAIWQKISPLARKKQSDSIMISSYPQSQSDLIDKRALEEISWLQDIITNLRNLRSANGVAPTSAVDAALINLSDDDQQRVRRNSFWLQNLARLQSLETCSSKQIKQRGILTAPFRSGEIGIIIATADLQALRSRLDSSIEKNAKFIQALERKLGNEQFIDKAPAAVVEQQRAKLAQIKAEQQSLQTQRQRLKK